jgi:glucose-1-phosphate thymidylyltransferase
MYKGIILAGGSGTRLHPSSLVVSKQLMNVYDKPLIYYPLCTLMIAGIKDILIITNENQVDQFERLLGDGSHLGVNISYKVQDNPNGLPEAFVIAEDFIGDDNVCMVLGDNIIFGNNLDSILKESQKESGATILSYPVRDPERFGVIEFEKYDEGNVVSIVEKPEHPKSNRALIGIYFFDNRCIEYAKQLKPSKRGETEIIDLCKKYLETDELNVKNLTRTMTWIDAGTFESLLLASNFVSNFEKIQSYKISCPEEVAYKNRWIDGKQLLKLSESYPKSGYGDYLSSIIEDY